MSRELMFSVTIKDCDVQEFRAGGNGGQKQNKTSTGQRVIHRASGARGESREFATQLANKRAAFRRMAESKEFKLWHQRECARITGEQAKVEAQLEQWMKPHNIKVEIKDEEGRWVEEQH
jgi:protein subunit release factor B